ncbi:MAG TPA: hypothetical protein VNL71_19070, partial [Chloroflexota bacterium]|nr:hypothetical protein [Chloroflexota bacterium]
MSDGESQRARRGEPETNRDPLHLRAKTVVPSRELPRTALAVAAAACGLPLPLWLGSGRRGAAPFARQAFPLGAEGQQ